MSISVSIFYKSQFGDFYKSHYNMWWYLQKMLLVAEGETYGVKKITKNGKHVFLLW